MTYYWIFRNGKKWLFICESLDYAKQIIAAQKDNAVYTIKGIECDKFGLVINSWMEG